MPDNGPSSGMPFFHPKKLAEKGDSNFLSGNHDTQNSKSGLP